MGEKSEIPIIEQITNITHDQRDDFFFGRLFLWIIYPQYGKFGVRQSHKGTTGRKTSCGVECKCTQKRTEKNTEKITIYLLANHTLKW